jgi:hypothetical protein
MLILSSRFHWDLSNEHMFLMENHSCANRLLRNKTRFISIGYLILFCCMGVAMSPLVAADVITSRCLMARHDRPGCTVARKYVTHDVMASHCHGTSLWKGQSKAMNVETVKNKYFLQTCLMFRSRRPTECHVLLKVHNSFKSKRFASQYKICLQDNNQWNIILMR